MNSGQFRYQKRNAFEAEPQVMAKRKIIAWRRKITEKEHL